MDKALIKRLGDDNEVIQKMLHDLGEALPIDQMKVLSTHLTAVSKELNDIRLIYINEQVLSSDS